MQPRKLSLPPTVTPGSQRGRAWCPNPEQHFWGRRQWSPEFDAQIVARNADSTAQDVHRRVQDWMRVKPAQRRTRSLRRKRRRESFNVKPTESRCQNPNLQSQLAAESSPPTPWWPSPSPASPSSYSLCTSYPISPTLNWYNKK